MTKDRASTRAFDRTLGAALETPALGAIVLVALGLLVSLPALLGQLTLYVDNPVHIAELRELASGSRGWTELAFCGFPLTVMQSPVVFGALAGLARTGLPLTALYTAATVVATLAPPLAVFHVARRRLSTPWALALAATLTIYRGMLVGYAAALAGMFAFYLASAALVLLLDALARPGRSWREVPGIAALVTFIGLTHMYVTIGVVYLAIVHTIWSIAMGGGRARRLVYDAAAFAVGVVASAAYWMPNVLARTAARGSVESFPRVLLLIAGTNIPAAPEGTSHSLIRIAYDPALYLDWVPQLIVCGIALWNVRAVLRSEDDLGRYGLSFAALLLGLLAIQPWVHVMLLGPQGTRLVYLAKLGILASAVTAVSAWHRHGTLRPATHARTWALLAAALFTLGWLSQRVVHADAAAAARGRSAEVEDLWTWLRLHRTPSWGRVYLEDTFGFLRRDSLSHSHALAETASRAGVEQVGAYYHNTPYDSSTATDEPALSEAWRGGGAAAVDRTVEIMGEVNATHLVLAEAPEASAFARDPRFEAVAAIGRFTVLALRRAESQWAQVEGGSGALHVERVAPGRIRLSVDGSVDRALIKESFHPFWRVVGARLARGLDGFIEWRRTDPQRTVFDLEYTPPALPWVTSLAGLSLIALLFAFRPGSLESVGVARSGSWAIPAERLSARLLPAAPDSEPGHPSVVDGPG